MEKTLVYIIDRDETEANALLSLTDDQVRLLRWLSMGGWLIDSACIDFDASVPKPTEI